MRKLLLTLVLLTGMAGATHAQPFCPGVTPWVFDDVQASDPFCGFITWMATSNVTLGCTVIDANHRLYCPDDFVTRKQMAAFMNRTANAIQPLTCAPGQVMKWNGAAWTCSDDNIGGSGGGGTVTSVLAGTGLQASPNPIVGAGAINLAPSFQLPQSCANGQVPKSNGTGGWTCGTDNAGTGTVTSVVAGAGLTGGNITGAGTIAVANAGITASMLAQNGCANGQVLKWNGSAWACAADAAGPANAFVQGGNGFGTEAVLGTTTNHALDIRVNGNRVMRYEPNTVSPNVIGGSPANVVTAGVRGATIAGGGVPAGDTDPIFNSEAPNRVTDVYGTVGGGFGNRAGDDAGTTTDSSFATVGGGERNTASGYTSTVGGGLLNAASGQFSVIDGGDGNTASATHSTVGGGSENTASGQTSTVGGGGSNVASGNEGTVGGGGSNTASGSYSTVSGGQLNIARGRASTVGGGESNTAGGDYSWTGGRGAAAQSADATPVLHHGAFVWADSRDFYFNSTANNQFNARATGGVRIVTAINGTGTPTAGVSLAPGDSAWAVLSDRAAKENWVDVDARQVLDRLIAMPIGWWNYKAQSADVRHIGPTAQDFRAAFGLGRGDTTIATIDADGVALSAIQGLNAKLDAKIAERDSEIRALREEVARMRAMQGDVVALKAAMALLMRERGDSPRMVRISK